jgi:hypothetical protein
MDLSYLDRELAFAARALAMCEDYGFPAVSEKIRRDLREIVLPLAIGLANAVNSDERELIETRIERLRALLA